LLRGREAPGADSLTREEANRIRAALRKTESEHPASHEGLDRLLFRMKREGLLDTPPQRARIIRFAMAAALVAALAVPFLMQLFDQEVSDDFKTRSLGLEVVLRVGDPTKTAKDLSAALQA